MLGELERHRPLEPPAQQLGLPLEAAPDPVAAALGELDLDQLTPIEALQKLYEMRSRLT